jgi:hypothetical protein
MTKFFLLLFSLFSIHCFSQRVLITGTAFDTTKGRNQVQIVVNDSLTKELRTAEAHLSRYEKYQIKFMDLLKDTNCVVVTKPDGTFHIWVKKSDSLYFHSHNHKEKVYAVADLLKMDPVNIQLEPGPCEPYVPCNDTVPSKVYVFVGEKIKVENGEPYCDDRFLLDSKFRATYKIVQQVIGNYSKDTITFTVFDHYGLPAFSKYNNALLFVSEYCGRLYHEKYQFFEVYKTADGRWASPGDPYRYDNYHRKDLQAKNICFADSVWFDVSRMPKPIMERQYPAPYYKIEGTKAIPVMGAYLDDLVRVKKDGVLKARKIHLD